MISSSHPGGSLESVLLGSGPSRRELQDKLQTYLTSSSVGGLLDIYNFILECRKREVGTNSMVEGRLHMERCQETTNFSLHSFLYYYHVL